MVQAARGVESPLTTRACATYLGFSDQWVRAAIADGVVVHGTRVQLEAEVLTFGSRRRIYRIHRDAFLDFLRAIGWSRLPALPLPLVLPAVS